MMGGKKIQLKKKMQTKCPAIETIHWIFKFLKKKIQYDLSKNIFIHGQLLSMSPPKPCPCLSSI